MSSDSYNSRFGGVRRLYGQPVIESLQKAHICVIGIGGVGSWSAEALARSGVGEVTLIDLDDICVTNTNRQIHALAGTIGQSKVEVMAARMRDINPELVVNEIEDFVTPENVDEYIDKRFDYVLDAIDNFRAKAAIIAHCKRNKISVITIGAAGGLTDPLKINVVDLTKTFQDPLAKKVKDFLRYRYNFSKNTKRRFQIECVFSEEAAKYPQPDGTVCEKKPDNTDSEKSGSMKMDCASGFGAATMVTATFGFVAVSRIIEKLSRRIN